MKKLLRLLGLVLGGLAALVVIAAVALTLAGRSRLNQAVDVEPRPLTIPTDEVALARGQHLATTFCADCHGANLQGTFFFDEPPIARFHAPNLTGLADSHSDSELVLAIRHGLNQDRQPLMVMPAESFIHFSQEDLGALIAYLKTIPPAGETQPEREILPVGRLMIGAGLFDSSIPATYIDHGQPFVDMPEIGPTQAYGQYLARFCQGCHGANLAGAQPPDPAAPRAPNLTPGGSLQGWTETDFMTAMRTGVKPSGIELRAEFMPWKSIGKLSDNELHALWLYLESLPPLPVNAE